MAVLIKKNYLEVAEEKVTLADSTGVGVRWLITEKDGASRYAMRRFEIQPGGRIGVHSHPEEHEIYILTGNGEIFNDQGSVAFVHPGDVLFILPHEKHGYQSSRTESLVFLCIIPILET